MTSDNQDASADACEGCGHPPHNERPCHVLVFYDRPGSPPGNGYCSCGRLNSQVGASADRATRQDGWYFVEIPGIVARVPAWWDSANEEWRSTRNAVHRAQPTFIDERPLVPSPDETPAPGGLPEGLDVESLLAERDRFRAALVKIDAIRNSIVGYQNVSISAHMYPLVAALGEAGFVGEDYEFASANAQTQLDRIAALEQWNAALEADREPSFKIAVDRDACQLCKGFRGGVAGNENIIDGVIACDYCSGTIYSYKRALDAAARKPEARPGEKESK